MVQAEHCVAGCGEGTLGAALEGASTFIGSPYWLAPEVIKEESDGERSYGTKADIWSVGATIVEFKVDYPGQYTLVDHALSRAGKGAVGILEVTGDKDDSVYKVGKSR